MDFYFVIMLITSLLDDFGDVGNINEIIRYQEPVKQRALASLLLNQCTQLQIQIV
jgi:hypothetical protein